MGLWAPEEGAAPALLGVDARCGRSVWTPWSAPMAVGADLQNHWAFLPKNKGDK